MFLYSDRQARLRRHEGHRQPCDWEEHAQGHVGLSAQGENDPIRAGHWRLF